MAFGSIVLCTMPVALFISASTEGDSVIQFADLCTDRQEGKCFIGHAALLCDSQPLHACFPYSVCLCCEFSGAVTLSLYEYNS